MLVKYRFGNFRSFKDDATLNMTASSQTTFNHYLQRPLGRRILPSAVVYGANASGKSNIISSLEIFRKIIISGSISNSIKELDELEAFPFVHDSEENPIRYYIEFINNGELYMYELHFIVGKFKKGQRKIVFESLSVETSNKSVLNLFKRSEESIGINRDEKALNYLGIHEIFLLSIADKINENIDVEDLFLTGGFKSSINNKISDSVTDFFVNKMIIIGDVYFNYAHYKTDFNAEGESNIRIWNKMLEGFTKKADFGPQKIRFAYKKNEKDANGDLELQSWYKTTENSGVVVPSELMESRGTLKIIDFAVIFQSIFNNGGVIVIDEFDAALHPELVKGIIAVFNDSEVNKNGAQLIFTTHNPIYLSNRLFRRDQILFTEKDRDSYRSTLYSLADFGSETVRNDENYLINYFKGKYSSLPYVDFSFLLSE